MTTPEHRSSWAQEAEVDIAGDIVAVGERWAIHGAVPLEGEVILGEFDTYDEAKEALDLLGRGR
jgi:hypothetical protein